MSRNYCRKLERAYGKQPPSGEVFFDDTDAEQLRHVFNAVGPKAAVWRRPGLPGPWAEWREMGKP